MEYSTEICHCMGVNYGQVVDALHEMDNFSDVLDAFKHVQEATSCSTGCGGCYENILDAISLAMNG